MLLAVLATRMAYIKGWQPVVYLVIKMNIMAKMARTVKDVIRQKDGIDIK